MGENYKSLYEQAKKMLVMYQDELIPGYRKKIEFLEKQINAGFNVGHNELQGDGPVHVLQRPVAGTLTREQWHTVHGWLKYGADHHHAKMLETLANCQDQKMACKIAGEHELAMQHAESVRKIVEGILYPTPEPEEDQDNAGG